VPGVTKQCNVWQFGDGLSSYPAGNKDQMQKKKKQTHTKTYKQT